MTGAAQDWLLSGDPAIAYQARRDLMGEDRPELRARIAEAGAGRALLAARRADGHWGREFYQPKWTSTHYTLLDLRWMEAPAMPAIRDSVAMVLDGERRPDGGMGPGKTIANSDVCVAGMVLNYASFFGAAEADLRSIVDFLLGQQMADGGFNCRSNRSGARHSSLHSTVSVLEGITAYLAAGHRHRAGALRDAAQACRDFVLLHRFFRSDRTGEIIHPDFLRFRHPWHWRYNILRALDAFRAAGAPRDGRMDEALARVKAARGRDGRWRGHAREAGAYHLPKVKGPNPWVTLIALRVLKTYG